MSMDKREAREIREALERVRACRDRLTAQQYRTLRGQVLAGEIAGALKGVKKILRERKAGRIILAEGIEKITILDEKSGQEIAVITNDLITTAYGVVVKLKPSCHRGTETGTP